MRLSKNFVLSEFEQSYTASRLGIENKIPSHFVCNVRALVDNVLQPVRDQFGPVVVTSGFRNAELNEAVGGSKTSEHMVAQAADFTVPGVDTKEVAEWIRDNLDFNQLILEFYNPETNAGWVHVSFSTFKNDKKVLTAEKNFGKTRYLSGLV